MTRPLVQVDSRPGATPYKLEFWSDIGRAPRKHRSRYYKTADSMQRAGERWENRDLRYWCRYWNGVYTWVSQRKVPR